MNRRWQANKIGLINFWYYDEQEFPLCRGLIIPKELDRETTTKFLEACEQFERIMNMLL